MAIRQITVRVSDDVLKSFNIAVALRGDNTTDLLRGFINNYIEETKKQLSNGQISGLL